MAVSTYIPTKTERKIKSGIASDLKVFSRIMTNEQNGKTMQRVKLKTYILYI